MPTPEGFTAKFRELLSSEILAESSLSEWQFAYRETIVIMATKILEQFSAHAACEPTIEAKSTGGSGGGGNPSFLQLCDRICHFLYLPAFVLEMHEAAPVPPVPNV
jgi:hypothetical protein